MELRLEHIEKSYRHVKKALSDISLTLTPGVYGLLGANGAGKTTLMNIITDNLRPDSGQVFYNGENISRLGSRYRSAIGYMPQQQGLYESFTASRFLYYMAALKGLDRKTAKAQIDDLLIQVNLQHEAHKRLGSFSGGMKQRILIAQALLGTPEILILDEPTAGLDPKERIRIRSFISEIAYDRIVIFVTHVVSDIECISDRVILLKSGRIIGNDTPSSLIETVSDKVFECFCQKQDINKLQKRFPFGNVMQKENGIVFRVAGDECPEGFRLCSDDKTLEDVYLYYFEYTK